MAIQAFPEQTLDVGEPTPSQQIRREGTAPEVVADIEPLLGRYRVMDLRDVGGFGSVLVCWDVRLQRRVAVKCLPLGTGTSSVTIEEGLAEARASSFLSHPNIVTVHDFEVDDDYAYLVMEYVDGVTLAELRARVEGGVLIFDEVAYLLRCLASALDFAHRNGVLHLDIKPQNVLIDRTGQVKLGDFGMASLASAAGWGGARGGTVGYMAPEQLEGELVDERSDVFSLATVVYEALSGTAPFAARDAAGSLRLIEAGAAPIQELEPELDPGVAEALMEALSPEAADREPSVARFARRLLDPSPTDSLVPGSLPGAPLGDPEAGLDSLRHLLAQTEGEEPAFDEGAWRSLDPPGRRIPHLAALCARVANALVTAAVALVAAPALGAGSLATGLIAGLGALLTLLWCPLGSALGIVVGGLALGTLGIGAYGEAGGGQLLVLCLLTLGLGALWWIAYGREGRLGPAALLLPTALAAPSLAPGLAGYALRPVAAGVTGGAAAALALVLTQALGAGAVVPWAAPTANLAPATPGFWLLVGACAAGAWLCALLNRAARSRLAQGRRGARPIAALGQAVAATAGAWGLAVGQALENGRIYAAPDAQTLAVLLGFFGFMLVVIGLFGPAQDLGVSAAPAGSDPASVGREHA